MMWAAEVTADATVVTDGEDGLANVIPTGLAALQPAVIMGTVHVSVVGTDGVLITVRIREGSDQMGTIVGEAVTRTVVATEAHDITIIVVDPSATLIDQPYEITVTVASASANTTVAYSSIVVMAVNRT